jgi:hypothetical protein
MGESRVDDSTAYLTPALSVIPTNDKNVGWHAQIAQSAMEANRLLRLVVDPRLNHKEGDIIVRTRLSPSTRAKQDHLGAGGRLNQPAPRLCNQLLIRRPHRKSSILVAQLFVCETILPVSRSPIVRSTPRQHPQDDNHLVLVIEAEPHPPIAYPKAPLE